MVSSIMSDGHKNILENRFYFNTNIQCRMENK